MLRYRYSGETFLFSVLGCLTLSLILLDLWFLSENGIPKCNAYISFLLRIHHPLLIAYLKYLLILLILLAFPIFYILGAFSYAVGDLITWIYLSDNFNVSPELLIKKIKEQELRFKVESNITLNDFISASKENIWGNLSQKYFDLSLSFSSMFSSVIISTSADFIIGILFFCFGKAKEINGVFLLIELHKILIIIIIFIIHHKSWLKISKPNKISKPMTLILLFLLFSFFLVAKYFNTVNGLKQTLFFYYLVFLTILSTSFWLSIHLRQIANFYLLLSAEANKRDKKSNFPS